MKFSRADAEQVANFERLASGVEGVERRKMFGYPAAFTNGHLFTGLFASDWFVRLPDADLAELTAAGGTPFEPMAGRRMRVSRSIRRSR